MQVFQFRLSFDTGNFKAELRINQKKWIFYMKLLISCMHFQSQLIEAAQYWKLCKIFGLPNNR